MISTAEQAKYDAAHALLVESRLVQFPEASIKAAVLREQWRAGQWECMSGIFKPHTDEAGFCVCCGFDPELGGDIPY